MTMRHDPIDPGHNVGIERAVFENPKTIVADRMSHPAVTIGWEDTVAQAARVMAERRIRHLPVVDTDRRLIGILTESDLREALAFEGVRDAASAPSLLIVGKVMTRDPVTVSAWSTLAAAVTLMHERKLSAVPVLDRDEVVGILTASDIVRAFKDTVDRG